MPNDKRKIFVASTMLKASDLNGHVFEVPMPCTAHGVWLEATGTVMLESVWCDGNNYSVQELSAEELKKFNDELREAVIVSDF